MRRVKNEGYLRFSCLLLDWLGIVAKFAVNTNICKTYFS